jgi:hypothetical protein
MTDELEPIDTDLAALYGAEKSAPQELLPPQASARVHAKVLAAVKAAPISAPLWSAKVAMTVAATFVAGGVSGAVLHASLVPERVVEHRVEVPVTVLVHEDASIAAPDAGMITLDAGTTVVRAVPVVRDAGAIEGVAAERRLLEAARAARARGRVLDALSALRRHRERFENGQLAEERDVLRIEILAEDGQASRAIEEAAAFRARYPDSVHRARLDLILARLESEAP